VVYSFITFSFLYFFAGDIVTIFSEKKDVIEMCVIYLTIGCLGHGGMYLGNYTNQMLNVTGRPKPVLIFNFFRVFLYIIPSVYFGSVYYGFKGLVIGLVAGNILSGIHAFFLGKSYFDKNIEKVLITETQKF